MRTTVIPPLFAIAVLAGCSSSSSSSTPADTGTPPVDGGDARAQATALARDDLPCKTDADCCVVFDLCRNQGYVVALADRDKATALAASFDSTGCNLCEPPPIQVACSPSGFCTGAKISCTSGLFGAASKNHCGALTLPAGCTAAPASLGGTPGLSPKKIISCG